MSLADRLNQIADETVVPRLAEPSEILLAGNRLRARRRRLAAITVAAAALLAVAATAGLAGVDRRAAPPPAQRIDRWGVTRTIEIPGNGEALYAADSLWVVDMKHRELVADGSAPAGEMYEIDPRSGDVLDRIPGAVGGWSSAGGGYIWLSTLASDLNVLTRVDLSSHQATRFTTSQPKQPPHGAVYVAGKLWVANTVSGDLVQMDPESGRVVQTVHVGEDVKGEAPFRPFTDGSSVWVSTDDGAILRFDGSTGEQLAQVQLPVREVRLVGLDTDRRVLYAIDGSHRSLFEVDMDAVGDWDGRELAFSRSPNHSFVAEVAVGGGALWVATGYPDELLRVDPVTFTVTGKMPLTGLDHKSDVAVDLVVGGGALWVRSEGKVLELRPGR